MKALILGFLFCFGSVYCLGQKQAEYCQTKLSPYGSNCYILKKLNNQSTKGTFERIQEFDDGQLWRGSGTFIETKNRIIFSGIDFIKKQYSFKDSTWRVLDTAIVKKVTFYKKDNFLIEYEVKGVGKRNKIIYRNPRDRLLYK
ncbi:MAG TPA: hypothetical protein VK668_05400 [Mucilaginibacter sp.]|nr:hypothetical protein [Mucilaginibacter sp.]